VVVVSESVTAPEGAEEFRVQFELEPSEALRVASQDPQISEESLVAAPVRAVVISQPAGLYPSRRTQAGRMLRRPIGMAPWPQVPTGAVFGSALLGMGPLVALQDVSVAVIGGCFGAAAGVVYRMVGGPGERSLSGRHLARSVGLRAIVMALMAGMTLRSLDHDDTDALHITAELRGILWRAAYELQIHDPDVPLDYRRWDALVEEVDEIHQHLLAAIDRRVRRLEGGVEEPEDRALEVSRQVMREIAEQLRRSRELEEQDGPGDWPI